MHDLTAGALLAAVEASAPADAGAYVIDDPEGRQLGALFVDRKRVCWAVAAGRHHRLRDLLRIPADAVPAALLDDALAPDAGRVALKQHTVESLINLEGATGALRWIAHRGPGYRPRWTFSAPELLAAVGAAVYPTEAEGACDIEPLAPQHSRGGSFVVGDHGTAVVVHELGGGLGVAALAALGEWAIAALDVTRGFSPGAIARLLAAARGPAALGWRIRKRLVHALIIDDPAVLARLVEELGRRGVGVVLSTRAPGAPGTDAGMVPVSRISG